MNKRLLYLFQQYAGNKCSEEELLEWYKMMQQTSEADLHTLMDAYYANLKANDSAEKVDWEFMFLQIVPERTSAPLKSLHFPRSRWWAAASILLLLGAASYFLFFDASPKPAPIVKISQPTEDVKAPVSSKAMITLSNGQQVLLDSLTSLSQGTVKIHKTTDGQIVYNGSAATLEYNTMINPRGSKVQPLTLHDGTKVWLNAESSIRFPTAFAGPERKVFITGEAYFEVAHDITKPFLVNKGDMQVQVLGTYFNVNSYDDEAAVKVTLLDGSVKIAKGSLTAMLKPGQQAQVSNGIRLVNDADLEQVMAWKNGIFQFEGSDIEEVMRQIARWYDVEVVYEVKPTQHFRGDIARNVDVSNVFKMLETTGAVHFRIQGKKVFVTK